MDKSIKLRVNEDILVDCLKKHPHVTYTGRSTPHLVNTTKIYLDCDLHGNVDCTFRKMKIRMVACKVCNHSATGRRDDTTPLVKGQRYMNNAGLGFEILHYKSCKRVLVKFIASGYKVYTSSSSIRRGKIRDLLHPSVNGVGYFGVGTHKSSYNGKDCPVYTAWRNMLNRCYNEKFRYQNPTYKDVLVCEDWLNFQRFAEWFKEHCPDPYRESGITYHLDKDKLSTNGKIYSPDTCSFLVSQENSEVSVSKTYTFSDPEGCIVEIFNLNKFCRENDLTHSRMHNVWTGQAKSYKGWTSRRGELDDI